MKMQVPYLCDEMLTLITSDTRKIIHCKSLLTTRFALIAEVNQDLTCLHELHVNLTWSQLKKILLFTDTLTLPSSTTGWIKLLTAADYFILTSRYNELLDQEARNFLLRQGIKLHVTPLSFQDYIKKLENPNYISALEYTKIVEDITRQNTEIQAEDEKNRLICEEEQRRNPEICCCYPQGSHGPIGLPGPGGPCN